MRWKDPSLPGRVSGVVETETGDLWVNGFSGISHVSAAELKKWLHDPGVAVSAEHLDELDGLPGLSGEMRPEPSVVEAPDGRLWFATTKGIAWLDPAALERNRNRLPPPVSNLRGHLKRQDLCGFRRTHSSRPHRESGDRLYRPEPCHSRARALSLQAGWRRQRMAGRRHAPPGVTTPSFAPGPYTVPRNCLQ